MAKASPAVVISHWYHLIENLQASPLEFYKAVEHAIEKRQVPDAKRSRVDWREGGLLSARREYLRVRRKDHVFDICGAPYGTGFFVSWWLGALPSGFLGLLAAIPWIGALVRTFIRPDTYYKMDSALMFQQATHAAVQEAVDGMTNAKGIRALTELERKPILREFYKR